MSTIIERRKKRKLKNKYIIKGTSKTPRLSVYRSNKKIYAQLIDDEKGIVLATAHEKEIEKRGTKSENAAKLGEIIAQKALSKKINRIIFDRSGYKYHGRVKSLNEAVRKAGLKY